MIIRVKPPIMPESEIHERVIEELWIHAKPGVLFWHTANQGFRSPQWAAKLKRMGLRPGVSDILLFYRRELFCLELKAANGRPTEAQLAFLGGITKQGGFGAVVHSIDAALRVLKLWGLLL